MAEPLRILMLNYEFPPIGGGAGRAHRRILDELAGRPDLTIDVLTAAPEPGRFEERPAENIRILRLGLKKKQLQCWTRPEVLTWLWRASGAYRRLLAETRYDLAHAFFGFPTGMVTWWRARRLPYILSLRGSDVPGLNARFSLDYKVLAPLFRRIWRRAEGVYACSAGLRDRALLLCPELEIGVVPNGVDTERFHPAGREPQPGRLRLLTVGRLSASKRIDMIIDALMHLRRRTEATLTIAGGGGLADELRQVVRDRGAEAYVAMPGIVSEERMPELYREHDVYVSASVSEGMSNAMLEAMASGLPIVTTRCEGTAELIDGNGVVVDARAETLADTVADLADDPGAYRAMADAAEAKARHFTWQRVAEQYLSIYRDVLEHQRNGDRS